MHAIHTHTHTQVILSYANVCRGKNYTVLSHSLRSLGSPWAPDEQQQSLLDLGLYTFPRSAHLRLLLFNKSEGLLGSEVVSVFLMNTVWRSAVCLQSHLTCFFPLSQTYSCSWVNVNEAPSFFPWDSDSFAHLSFWERHHYISLSILHIYTLKHGSYLI